MIARIVMGWDCAVVGGPLMTPVIGLSDSPAGSVPDWRM